MHGGPSGFQNAPVTRTFVIASGFLTIIFGIRGRALKLGLSYQEIFKQLRLWRIVASEFAFSSTPELMFGLYLLYYFRVFERQIGSNKYSVFILFSTIASLLFEVLTLALLKDTTSILASGPYSLIFASFVPFYLDIPVSSRFRIFGINFTDKSFVYLAGLQLLLSSWKHSLVPGICGILAGIFYCANAFYIRRIKETHHTLRQEGMLQEASLPMQVVVWREVIHQPQHLCRSHLNLLLPCWYQWALTAVLQDKHLCGLEMTSMWLQISFLNPNNTDSSPIFIP